MVPEGFERRVVGGGILGVDVGEPFDSGGLASCRCDVSSGSSAMIFWNLVSARGAGCAGRIPRRIRLVAGGAELCCYHLQLTFLLGARITSA